MLFRSRTTVWRACQRMGIDTRHRKGRRDRDARRYAYGQRMQMVLADFVHFRAGIKRARRVAVYFLDDATRYGLDVVVTTSEQAIVFLKALHGVISMAGLMDAFYLDRGPAFIANVTHTVFTQMEIPFIHGEARYPQGHGKIERFNRSVRTRLLRTLDGSPEVDPDLGALGIRLRHDLHEIYNHTPHESLKKQTPWMRWSQSRPLNAAPSSEWLKRCFTLQESRRVSNDHVIKYHGTQYEVPRGHGGKKIIVHNRILEDEALYVLHQGRFVRIHPVDTLRNAYSKRGTTAHTNKDTEATPHCKSSSTMAFEQAYSCVLDADGGFSDAKKTDTNNDINKE